MHGATVSQSLVLVGLSWGLVVLAGCESPDRAATDSDGYTTKGPHGVGSASQTVPVSPLGGSSSSGSPNTKGADTGGAAGNTGATGAGAGR